jgi:polygalacturonase
MNSLDLMRRRVLLSGGLGAAIGSIPTMQLEARVREISTGHDGPSLGIFDVRKYGAIADGKTLDTNAVNRAIEAAATAGGGTVVFPPGTYVCFSIHLKSHVNLYLEHGCVILAADSPLPGGETGYRSGTYDAAEPKTAWDEFQDFGHNHWHNSLFWGEGIEDISITGPGLIWGKGLSNGRGAKDDGTAFIAEQPGVGNKAIALKNCRNVLLRDFSILKGGHFGLLLTGVDNVTIDNLKIDTDRDGIDIDCCQNVRVSNCTVNSPWDDGICLKSSYALGYARPTKNLAISNCWVTADHEVGTVLDGTFKKFAPNSHVWRIGRIKCGTESNGGFINITISNCIFDGCHGYALETVDGALLEDITISNTTMRNLISGPIFMRLGARLRGPKGSTKVGSLKRVLINNLECHNAARHYSSILGGIPGHPIEDVKLSNIYVETSGGAPAAEAGLVLAEAETGYPEPTMFGITPASGFYLRHVQNIEMNHVEIANVMPDYRPAFHLDHVERADFFAITAPRGTEGAFSLRQVKDLRVGWSRAANDTVLEDIDYKRL